MIGRSIIPSAPISKTRGFKSKVVRRIYVEGRGDTTVAVCTHINRSYVAKTQSKEAARRLRQMERAAKGARS